MQGTISVALCYTLFAAAGAKTARQHAPQARMPNTQHLHTQHTTRNTQIAILHKREWRLKRQWLGYQGTPPPPPLLSAAFRTLLAGPALLLASFLVAETALALTRPYACPA